MHAGAKIISQDDPGNLTTSYSNFITTTESGPPHVSHLLNVEKSLLVDRTNRDCTNNAS